MKVIFLPPPNLTTNPKVRIKLFRASPKTRTKLGGGGEVGGMGPFGADGIGLAFTKGPGARGPALP